MGIPSPIRRLDGTACIKSLCFDNVRGFSNEAVLRPFRDPSHRTVRPFDFQRRGFTLSAVGQWPLGFLPPRDPNGAPGTIGIELDDTTEAYFKRLLAMPPPTDAWIASHRNQMLETSGEFPGLVQASDFPPFNGYIADVLPLAEDNYRALVGMAGALVPQRAWDSVGNVPSRPPTFRQVQGSGSTGWSLSLRCLERVERAKGRG